MLESFQHENFIFDRLNFSLQCFLAFLRQHDRLNRNLLPGHRIKPVVYFAVCAGPDALCLLVSVCVDIDFVVAYIYEGLDGGADWAVRDCLWLFPHYFADDADLLAEYGRTFDDGTRRIRLIVAKNWSFYGKLLLGMLLLFISSSNFL